MPDTHLEKSIGERLELKRPELKNRGRGREVTFLGKVGDKGMEPLEGILLSVVLKRTLPKRSSFLG